MTALELDGAATAESLNVAGAYGRVQFLQEFVSGLSADAWLDLHSAVAEEEQQRDDEGNRDD